MSDDKRLIEDYLPIADISAAACAEKAVRRGHISNLHLWWARRPVVASRAAVYGALVPAAQFVPNGGTDAQKKSLGRANAAKFIKRLCRYPNDSRTLEKADISRASKEAQEHILKAHADRLSKERGKTITVEDIIAGRAPRPHVLDMFAGGGAIPLEALRLGCQAYALDLNPVAHIIELCTLVYPQKFGKPNGNARGAAGPKDANGEATWGGLPDEVRYWGDWVLKKVRAEIGDIYSPIPDPEAPPAETGTVDGGFEEPQKMMGFADDPQPLLKTKAGYLTPVAYLWTRAVRCKNPTCAATVPLVKQTWLCKKEGRYVALKMTAQTANKCVRFEVVEAASPERLGFAPDDTGSEGGNAICPFCGTVSDNDYVQSEGRAKRVTFQMLAAVCTRPNGRGKIYLGPDQVGASAPDEQNIRERISNLCMRSGITVPTEPINPMRPSPNARGMTAVTRHGLATFADLFAPRQMLCLLTFVYAIREAHITIHANANDEERATAVCAYLALALDKVAEIGNCLGRWEPVAQCTRTLFGRHALSMLWDFGETVPLGTSAGNWEEHLGRVVDGIELSLDIELPAIVARGSATNLPWPDMLFDAVITDPPYYDNVPYADISDFFYVWLKRSIGHLYPEHFATELTPKKAEATALASRHGGDMEAAEREYENTMARAFAEVNRVLKPGGQLTVVYAHKTTLGWATLVEALRVAGFTVTEAWPLDTEMKARMIAMDTAALASSIFLVARKRDGAKTANYEEQVRPELEEIVRERVETLWDMGISGADLVIASVGAGLRAFTRFARVEYANGEEVPAERFLTEVETVVLETILARLSKEVGGKGGQYSLASLDTASRFYVLWRYTYGAAELDAGEAIIFANGTHVELDGQQGLTGGNYALVEKKKSKYRLRDYAERGEIDKLGLATENGQAAPLVDVLHRTLWLMEKRPTELGAFLSEAQPNREALRLVAQALAGPALKGGEMGDISPTAELSALGKLMANWQNLIEDAALTTGQKEEHRTGQKQLM